MPLRGAVPDGDVAAGLVGHVNLVPLLAEPNERPPHTDDVVIRMGAEDYDSLREGVVAGNRRRAGGADDAGPLRRRPLRKTMAARPPRLAPRPTADRVLHRAEDVDVDVVGPAAGREKILEAVLVVILVGELEDRLLERGGQPDHRLPHEPLGPLHPQQLQRPDKPRGDKARQPRRGRPIEDKPGVGMLLKGAGRDLARRRLLHRFGDDRCLVLTEGEEDDTAGIEDRPDPHRDRLARDIPLAEEVAGSVGPRHMIERDQPRAALRGAARFVEPDVAGAADS